MRPRTKPPAPVHPLAYIRAERHADAKNRVDFAIYTDPNASELLLRHKWWEQRPPYLTRVCVVAGLPRQMVRLAPIVMQGV